ncbi:MAG: deoxynucleoside kinase [Ignavibacteriales bacterium]|nr:deoxynucleoside kinase [Ignavibacteriales bacterium]
MDKIRYIAIEGVIGVGKTSLSELLNKRLNSLLILEEFDDNPFLEKFYSDKEKYAFQTQMHFLISRYKQLLQLNQADLFFDYLISDYIFDKDQIFAYLNLNDEELNVYDTIFPMLKKNLPKPDIVIYLQSTIDRILQNIKKRNRKIEKQISKRYLQDLCDCYNRFFFNYDDTPLIIVNANEIDFVNNKSDFDELFNQIFRKDRARTEYFNPGGLLVNG